MTRGRINPTDTVHRPLPAVPLDAPITITGAAATEVRRLARRFGPGAEKNVATLAAACALRGAVDVERELEVASAYVQPRARRNTRPADDDAGETL